MPTRVVVGQIERLGYAVRTRPTDSGVEMVAVKLDNSGTSHAVTLADPSDPDERYRAACRLAELVGIDLEDG